MSGAEHLVSYRPAVFLFNHQSQLDVIVLAKMLSGEFTAVAKKEAASIPGFGAAFRLADVAFVDRGNTTAAKAALEPAVQRRCVRGSRWSSRRRARAAPPRRSGRSRRVRSTSRCRRGADRADRHPQRGRADVARASTIREGTVQVTVLPPVPTDSWTIEGLDGHVAAGRAQYLEALEQGAPAQGVARPAVEVTTGPTGPVHAPLEWGTGAELEAGAAAGWRSGSARSTLTLLELLDPAPDPLRLTAAHEWASRMVPRMRQTVVEPALGAGPPVWVGVAGLDLDQHLTRVRLPAPGPPGQLLDAVAAFAAAPLDRSRPLWAALLVEGLADGSAGYAVKIHHSVTDGVGAVRLMGMLHSRTAEHDPARPEPPVPAAAAAPSPAQALARLGADVLTHAVGTMTGWSGRALAPPADPATRRTPLLAGRGGARRAEVLEVPYADLRVGAAAAGGSPTDGFLAAVLGALREYHRHFGVDAGGDGNGATVALGLPVGLGRQDGADGRLAGDVVRVPLTVAEGAERIRAVRELVLSTGPSGPLGADVQVASVPGIGHPVWFAGWRVTRLYPLGPLAGCAAAITMVAHDGTACVGIVLDDAVTEPDLLVDGVRAGLAEVLAPGPVAHPGVCRRSGSGRWGQEAHRSLADLLVRHREGSG